MKKYLVALSLTLSMPTVIMAQSSAHKKACQITCTSSEKDVDGAIKGFETVLAQVGKEGSEYEKRHKELKKWAVDSVNRSGRMGAAQHQLLSRHPGAPLPKFSSALFHKHIKKHSNINYCFSDCGTKRLHEGLSTSFMFPYFIKVIARLGRAKFKKLLQYRISPLIAKNTLELLDMATRKISDAAFERILHEKAIDDDVRKYLKEVRNHHASFLHAAGNSN